MAMQQLDIAPRTRGRGAKALVLEPLGELSPADLALLASERGVKPPGIKLLRERHHALARCLAGGMSNAEASIITGYDPSRISILKSDPMFEALIEDYKSIGAAVTADFVERTNLLALTVVNSLMEDLENEDQPISIPVRLEIAKFAADRTGNGPTTKTSNVNVNINLGERLRAARERSNALLRDGTLPSAPPDEPIDITPRRVG